MGYCYMCILFVINKEICFRQRILCIINHTTEHKDDKRQQKCYQ